MAEVQTPATEQVGASWGAMDPAEVDNTAFFTAFCYLNLFLLQNWSLSKYMFTQCLDITLHIRKLNL